MQLVEVVPDLQEVPRRNYWERIVVEVEVWMRMVQRTC